MEAHEGDRVWSIGSIRRLFNGEARYVAKDATGREFEGTATSPTAFELRSKAEEGGAPLHTILDVIQLERAIDAIQEFPVKVAAQLRVKMGLTDEEIEGILRAKAITGTDAWRLIDKAVRLVAAIEGARAEEVDVDREGGKRKAVCWRCMERPVQRAGHDCGAKCPALVDGAARPKRDDLGNWNLERLIDTQDKGSVPGSKYASNMESPVGLIVGAAS